jgi:hypothetical protein
MKAQKKETYASQYKKEEEIEILGNTITVLHFGFFVRELLTRE